MAEPFKDLLLKTRVSIGQQLLSNRDVLDSHPRNAVAYLWLGRAFYVLHVSKPVFICSRPSDVYAEVLRRLIVRFTPDEFMTIDQLHVLVVLDEVREDDISK